MPPNTRRLWSELESATPSRRHAAYSYGKRATKKKTHGMVDRLVGECCMTQSKKVGRNELLA